ncbi:MAG TPA: helix-turn-helix transcriptional regulator [Blastocatellia bacterium]|nr:helix-turn-helix transcriptional regulator [Blastocatellia bacterium]
MAKKGGGDLARYIARVLKEKDLSLHDVQVMSGWKITDAYIGSIIRGRASNPSVEKLQALALGLGVDEDEIFRVARGAAGSESNGDRNADPWQSVMILRLMEQVVSKPDLKEILEEVVELSEEDRAFVLRTAKSFRESPPKRHRRRKPI